MSNSIDLKLDNKSTKYFSPSKNKGFITVPFDEIFKEKEIAFINEFNLKRKRTYVNISELICTYNNKLLSYDRKKYIITNYLLLKYKINSDKYKDNQEFINDIYTILFNKYVQNLIRNFVESHYQFDLDSKEIKKYNPGLQFTDSHAKALHMISTSMKLIIPVILEYAYSKNIDVLEFNDFILQCYDPLFTIYIDENETDLANKLYQSVYSRVIATKYSDNTFWSYCTSIGFSPEELTFNLTKKLMIDIIPKYKFSENIISFNHVVINNSIEYTFRFNFPVNFKALSLIESDEDGLTEFDRVAINTARINESVIIMNKINVKMAIKYLLNVYKLKITKEEIEFYLKDFKINNVQKNILFLFFAKYFGSMDGIYSCTLREYVLLLIILKKILIKNNFILLHKIITAKVSNNVEKKIINKKNFTKIMDSSRYRKIINSRYKDSFSLIFINNNIIIKLLASIMNNKFLNYSFKAKKNNLKLIKVNSELIIEEFLRFLEMI